jgi:anthranilate synthase component 1
MKITREQFTDLANQAYNRVPVIREVLADLDTPLSTYLKLADGPYSYLLESVHGGEKWGRYSIIGLPCQTRLEVTGHQIRVNSAGEVVEQAETADPLAWIASFQQRYRAPDLPGLPRFAGGLVGYFGYDTVRYIEPRLGECPSPDPLEMPDILLMASDELVVFDNLSGKLFIVAHADPATPGAWETAQARLDTLTERLRRATPNYRSADEAFRVSEADFVSGLTREGFQAAVRRAKQYIVDGDIMQVVLSQRLSIPFRAPPLDLYRALRGLNPSPYMYYLDLGDSHIVGSSPEILVRLEDDVITVRPIAGTRPRGATEKEDHVLERELLNDPKERAEHVMLIDLGRNDVGRVAKIGTVRLTEQMVIERYSHVMHIVSNVIGRLDPNLSCIDALRATFPAGTVSGAPKIRAMEIIDELEPVKRGVYAGAVGYLDWRGDMDTAIAIRIVHDSVPEREWEETMNKGRAIFRAVAQAEAGLHAPSGEV